VPNGFTMDGYDLMIRNCEHVACACSTDEELINRCIKEYSQPGMLNHSVYNDKCQIQNTNSDYKDIFVFLKTNNDTLSTETETFLLFSL
jgi:hypothetical protein